MASSAYVISINPDDIDPKIAMETGYAILMDKPIILVVPPETGEPNVGLKRIAHHVIRLTAPMSSEAGQQELMAKLGSIMNNLPD